MPESLAVIVDEDTVWLQFNASNGKSAMISMSGLINAVHGKITEDALTQWCADRKKEAAS